MRSARNSAGAVKTSGGDVYAGADGNVYKKTDSGWEKYSGSGSWSSVQAPAAGSASKGAAGADARTAPQERPGAAGSNSMGAESGMRGRFSGEGGGGGFQQLEQDRSARFGGAERQRQFGASEGGRFGGGGFGRRR